jgi:shikimate 5-dehydrogenase
MENSKILGIFYNPIEHSFSLILLNLALKKLKLNYLYIPFLIEENIDILIKTIKKYEYNWC